MKLNLKLKTLAAAVALVATHQGANAAVVSSDATTGNSSFLFFAFDNTSGAELSYIQGLNVRLDDLVAAPHATKSFDLSGLSTAFAGHTGAVWGVVAADAVGSGFSNFRVVTSEQAALGTPAPNATALRSATSTFQNFLTSADKGLLAGTPIITNVTSDDAFAGKPLWNANWGGQLQNDTTDLTNGSTLVAWLIDAKTINAGHRNPDSTQLDTWRLNLSGNKLFYAAPVPLPAAAWMLGSGLMGLVGVARRRNV